MHRRSHGFFYNFCQRLDEEGRSIQRFYAREVDAVLLRLLARADFDIVQNLQVVRQELYWRDQNIRVAGRS